MKLFEGIWQKALFSAVEETSDGAEIPAEAIQENPDQNPDDIKQELQDNIPPTTEKKSNNKCVIVEIHFNSKGLNKDRLSKKWIDYRMKIFLKYTRKSLMKQTNKNFKTFLYYADESEPYFLTVLEKYRKHLPENFHFIRKSDRMPSLLRAIKGYNYLYLVRIDSDDLYHRTFIDQLHRFKPKPRTKALINQYGFWYDSVRGRLAAVKYDSPPFYTLIYKTRDFEAGKIYKIKSHGSVIRLPHEVFKSRNYVVVLHKKNTATKFRIRKGRDFLIKRSKIGAIIKKFY